MAPEIIGVTSEECADQSLGVRVSRVMPTNSKSGELFLFSDDRQFIIKTLSGKEQPGAFCRASVN